MLLVVRVKPNAHVADLTQAPDGTWLARLRSPPVDGKANTELVALLAAHFGCRKADVTIRSGAGARLKRIEVGGR